MRPEGAGIHLASRDHASVGYRVPREWAALDGGQREAGSLAAFKRRSRGGFLWEYGAFVCGISRCVVCNVQGSGGLDE